MTHYTGLFTNKNAAAKATAFHRNTSVPLISKMRERRMVRISQKLTKKTTYENENQNEKTPLHSFQLCERYKTPSI